MPDRGTSLALSEGQDVDVNYYVIVPFTTVAAAEWAASEIGTFFDCHVISAAAVDQGAPLIVSVSDDDQSLVSSGNDLGKVG